MQYVIIISLGDNHAAYGPFQTAQIAQQWLSNARDKRIIGLAMKAIVSAIYSVENL